MFCVFNFFIYNLQWKRQTQDDCVACPLLVQLDENACDRDALAPLNMLSMCPLLGGWTRATDEGDGRGRRTRAIKTPLQDKILKL